MLRREFNILYWGFQNWHKKKKIKAFDFFGHKLSYELSTLTTLLRKRIESTWTWPCTKPVSFTFWESTPFLAFAITHLSVPLTHEPLRATIDPREAPSPLETCPCFPCVKASLRKAPNTTFQYANHTGVWFCGKEKKTFLPCFSYKKMCICIYVSVSVCV